MLNVLTEQELPKFVREMVKGRDDVTIAVAFWGKEAETLLGLEKAIGGRILCNPQLGYCDEKLINQLKKQFKVFAHPKMHAKIYMTAERAAVGSSNASTNGFVQGFEFEGGLREMNLGIDDSDTLKTLTQWFEVRWAEKVEITPDMFSKVQFGKSIIPPKSGSLIEAARESPSYFQHLPIYLTLYREFVDHETRAEIKQTVRKLKVGDLGVKPPTTARSSVKGTTTKLESLLGRYWEYLNWGNDFPRDAWLIDVANVRKAHVYGISRSYSEVPSLKLKDGSKADLSFRRPNIIMPDRKFKLTEEDKALLQNSFDMLWNHPKARGGTEARSLAFGAALDVLLT